MSKRPCEDCRWCVWYEPFEQGTCACAYNGMTRIKDEKRETCPNWEDAENDYKHKTTKENKQ